MVSLRSLWESLYREGNYTIFQNFPWNLLALNAFTGREQSSIVCAQSSSGAAIVPVVRRRHQPCLRLLGDELFDYRAFLHCGDEDVLRSALTSLARLTVPLEIVAVRENDLLPVFEDLTLERFSGAPFIRCADLSSDEFAAMHSRLGRNLRRLARLGYELKLHNGGNARLLRLIYQRKAIQDPASLFHDPLRVDFLLNAAAVAPDIFEIFTLENAGDMCAALVTFRDRNVRRFYTGWFDPTLDKHSPGMTLIHEVTRLSLDAGLDCDYMTGEQPYKLRLATGSTPLYRLRASTRQLAELDHCCQRLSA